jgi:two-component system response regulator DesR
VLRDWVPRERVPRVIRILLADDQHLVRGALAALLALEDDFEVVASVADGAEAVQAAIEHRPDVALLDVEMPGLDGVAATRQIVTRAPGVRVMILTTFGRPGYLRRAMDAGARGFMVKDAPPDRLAAAVRQVHLGRTVVDPALAVASLSSGANPLSEREADALRAAEDGGTVADIARTLILSEGTVRNYLSAAIGKTGARTRAEAARVARENGWL